MIKTIILVINILIIINLSYSIILIIKQRKNKTKDKSFIIADNYSDGLYIIKSSNTICNYYDLNRKTIRLTNSIYNDNSSYSNFITSYICESSNENYKIINIINKFLALIIYCNVFMYILLFLSIFSNNLELMLTSFVFYLIFFIIDLITLNEKEIISNKLNIEKDKLAFIKFYYSNIICHSILVNYFKIK